MLFWRAKSAKQAAKTAEAVPENLGSNRGAAAVAAVNEGISDPAAEDASGAATSDDETNVVKLAPARLKDRLADFEIKPKTDVDAPTPAESTALVPNRTKSLPQDCIEPGNAAALPGQATALSALRESLNISQDNGHVLIVGAAGTGRRSATMRIARDIARTEPSSSDLIYAAHHHNGERLQAYAVTRGEGARIVRDIKRALAKSSAMLDRLIASDDHRMNLAVLEDDHRHRLATPLDNLKRRAEAQNIAVVKTLEGFVLAPMHEGKVVRAEVFRALPDALQRDVGTKIAALETELQTLLVALPGSDSAADDKFSALSQDMAERALKPNLAVARKLFKSNDGSAPVFDAVESDWLERASAVVYGGGTSSGIEGVFLQAIGTGQGEGAPVVVARNVCAADINGEIGRDSRGRLAIRPGHLADANGGFLIVEAWRLATDPTAWSVLSEALETGTLQPQPSSGLAVAADPVPLQIKLVLIADETSLGKLKAIDPGIMRHFSSVVTFAAIAPAADVSENDFASWAAAIAEANGWRPIEKSTGPLLHTDAKERARVPGRISLDVGFVVDVLRQADGLAEDASSAVMRFSDVRAAIKAVKSRVTT